MRALLIAVALLSCASDVAAAGVYKCTDAAGKVSFTDRPCPSGSGAEALKIRTTDPASSPVPGARDRLRGCIDLARPAWDLLGKEAAGQLSGEEVAQLQSSREALATQCGQRLSSSTLNYECRQQMAVLTRATARASDPDYAADRDRLQAEFDRRCGEAQVREDIELHLRSLGTMDAPAPPPQ